MRAVVQRVSSARVEVDGAEVARVDAGLLVYLGVAPGDGDVDANYVVEKVRFLRIFADAEHKLNLDVVQAGGSVLVVSAFTLQADARKGRRPSFESAADPDKARTLYVSVCDKLAGTGVRVERGTFRAMMRVHSVNDGPICVLLDSKKLF